MGLCEHPWRLGLLLWCKAKSLEILHADEGLDHDFFKDAGLGTSWGLVSDPHSASFYLETADIIGDLAVLSNIYHSDLVQ